VSILFGKPRLAIKGVPHVYELRWYYLRVLRASPSCICAKILSWPAASRGWQYASRLYAITPRPNLARNMLNQSKSL